MNINVWNPICKRMFYLPVVNSFHGIYGRSIYRYDKSVYLVKNTHCYCLKYQLVSNSMISKEINMKQLYDITNDIKIKFPTHTNLVEIKKDEKCICKNNDNNDEIISNDEIIKNIIS